MTEKVKILATIVLYNEPLYDTPTYKSLLKNSGLFIFVYDNSPIRQQNTFKSEDNLFYIHDGSNGGVSIAYNAAAKYAIQNGFEWILLLDQDTLFPEGTLEKYYAAIKNHSSEKLFAPHLMLDNNTHFSPSLYRNKRGQSVLLREGIHPLPMYSPVNCGMCIHLKSFWLAGGYNEAVRIDYADFQFIERFASVCPHFCLVDVVAVQSFSNEEKDMKKMSSRFLLYLESIRGCERKNVYENICYLYVVFRHTIALTVRTCNLFFIKVFFKKYLFKL